MKAYVIRGLIGVEINCIFSLTFSVIKYCCLCFLSKLHIWIVWTLELNLLNNKEMYCFVIVQYFSIDSYRDKYKMTLSMNSFSFFCTFLSHVLFQHIFRTSYGPLSQCYVIMHRSVPWILTQPSSTCPHNPTVVDWPNTELNSLASTKMPMFGIKSRSVSYFSNRV